MNFNEMLPYQIEHFTTSYNHLTHTNFENNPKSREPKKMLLSLGLQQEFHSCIYYLMVQADATIELGQACHS